MYPLECALCAKRRPCSNTFRGNYIQCDLLNILVGMQLGPVSALVMPLSGEVGQQMVRPMNLLAQHAAMELGEKMFNFFTCILPCIVAAKIVYNALLFPATLADVLFFLLSALLGNMIFLLLNTILGYTAFWLGNVWYIQWFLTAAMYVFGGEWFLFGFCRTS